MLHLRWNVTSANRDPARIGEMTWREYSTPHPTACQAIEGRDGEQPLQIPGSVTAALRWRSIHEHKLECNDGRANQLRGERGLVRREPRHLAEGEARRAVRCAGEFLPRGALAARSRACAGTVAITPRGEPARGARRHLLTRLRTACALSRRGVCFAFRGVEGFAWANESGLSQT